MAYPTTGRHMSITISPLRSVRAASVLINATIRVVSISNIHNMTMARAVTFLNVFIIQSILRNHTGVFTCNK